MSDIPSPAPKKRTRKSKPDTSAEQLPEKTVEPKPVKKQIVKPKEEEPIAKPEEQTDQIDQIHKPVPEEFLKDLGALAEIFENNPDIIDPIREVFEYHLVDPIDRKTFPKTINAMSMLLGVSATMVLMTACHVNSAGFFENLLFSIKDEKQKAAVWILQHLTSLYGSRIQIAYTLSIGTMDEDWHTVDVNTYRREGDTPIWNIEMNMMLYDGTETKVRMTPDSAFQLVEILAAELANNIPKENIDEALITKCEKNFTAFYEKFYSDKDSRKNDNEHPAGYA
ncbi:MAG TPA: hypothetical protein VJY43_05050 [Methanocorpusculum sp.]|nr:hypothetical protein [Methanocorpusculum sp.]